MSCSAVLDSSEQHPLDLCTRVDLGFPTIDDVEIVSETEPIEIALDDLSGTRETYIWGAPPGAALQFMRSWNSSVDLLRRHTLTSVIHITISS